MANGLTNLPVLLSAIPLIVWLLSRLSELRVFDWLGDIIELPYMIVFFPPALLFDSIGLINFNILDTGGPEFMGSKFAAEAVYVIFSSALLYLLGKLLLRLFLKA